MEFLANENFPLPSVLGIRKGGFIVKSIAEENPGISDEAVLDLAIEDSLIILTFDRDYGELLFKYKKDPPPAVVYFRSKGINPDEAGQRLLDIIQSQKLVLEGFFTVIEDSGIRQRKLE